MGLSFVNGQVTGGSGGLRRGGGSEEVQGYFQGVEEG